MVVKGLSGPGPGGGPASKAGGPPRGCTAVPFFEGPPAPSCCLGCPALGALPLRSLSRSLALARKLNLSSWNLERALNSSTRCLAAIALGLLLAANAAAGLLRNSSMRCLTESALGPLPFLAAASAAAAPLLALERPGGAALENVVGLADETAKSPARRLTKSKMPQKPVLLLVITLYPCKSQSHRSREMTFFRVKSLEQTANQPSGEATRGVTPQI
mmetsp:Transcript_1975/g.5374  ORF Transcript_1975/g.5374 Transcript_1975/m.5374 type:complete len:217 (+) Transcript_1975:1613-2263(+)